MRHLTSDRAEKARIYKARKKAGVCTRCGKVPPRESRTTCAECAKRASKAAIKYQHRVMPALKKLHVCLHCLTSQAVPGRRLCGACAERMVDQQRERRQKRREQGLCPYCGEDAKGRSMCDECRAERNRHSSAYHARLRAAA